MRGNGEEKYRGGGKRLKYIKVEVERTINEGEEQKGGDQLGKDGNRGFLYSDSE